MTVAKRLASNGQRAKRVLVLITGRLKHVKPSRMPAIRFRLQALAIANWSQSDQIGAHDGLPPLD